MVAAQTAPKAPATAQPPTGPDILVNGVVDQKRGNWKRAESDHVILIGTDSSADLTRLSNNLERLYRLMSRLYRGSDQGDLGKVTVTLIESSDRFRALDLGPLRAEQGRYPTAFADQSYYDPREDGDVLAVAKSDQLIDLDTRRAYNLDCDEAMEKGAQDCIGSQSARPPAVRKWEAILYAAFAERFMLTYHPAAFPRWYIDGIGALFSTMTVKRHGAIDYGNPPLDYNLVFRSYGDLDVGEILTGHYLEDGTAKGSWTPYHAWLLTHYFVLSDLKPVRAKQFHDYMAAVAMGKPMAEAAAVFGDMKALQRDLLKYVRADKSFSRAKPPEGNGDDPVITALSPGSAALVEARIELGARLAAAAPDAPKRDDWIAQVRSIAVRFPQDTETTLFAAEAECRGGHTRDCLADAEHVLATSPENVRALTWKGVALTDLAAAAPPAERAPTIAIARRTIERAITLDNDSAPALIAYFQSFAKVGDRVPDPAMLGMVKVIRLVPAAPAPRLYLAEELVRQGHADLARSVMHIVLYGPYDSPERKAASKLFATADASRSAG